MSNWTGKLRTFVTVEPVLFFFMACSYTLMPTYQQLIIKKVSIALFPNLNSSRTPASQQQMEEIQTHASHIILLVSTVLTTTSILPVLLLGSVADQVGRRPVMVLPSLMSLLSCTLFIVVDQIQEVSAYWCLLGAAFIGVTGNLLTVFQSCHSYLADVTSESDRTQRIAIADAILTLGGATGFLLGGFLREDYGLSPALGFILAGHVFILLYIMLWLREPKMVGASPPAKLDEGREGDEEGIKVKSFILQCAKHSVHVVFRKRPGWERLKVLLLLLCSSLNNIMINGEDAILLLYLMYKPRNFTSSLYGVYSAVNMLLLGSVLLVGFPFLLRYFRKMTLIKISIVFRAASYVLMSCATNKGMVFLVAVLGAPNGICRAGVYSTLSMTAAPDEQGAIFSAVAFAEAICNLFAASIFNGLYPLTLPTFPGMPYIVLSGLCAIQLILIQWVSEISAPQAYEVLQD